MSAGMPGQEENRAPPNSSSNDDIRRRAKGRLDDVLAGLGQGIDLVEAAASDDANGWFHAAEE